MPVLKTTKETCRFYLPTTDHLQPDDPEKAWVDMNIGRLVGEDIVDVETEHGEGGATISMLAGRITDWNYTDETGAKLPINFDTVKFIAFEDLMFLQAKMPQKEAMLSSDQKKI